MRRALGKRPAGALAMVAAVLAGLACSAGPAAASPGAPAWTAASAVTLPSGAASSKQYANALKLACVSAERCVGAGEYVGSGGEAVLSQIELDGGSAASQAAPSVGKLVEAERDALACAPEGSCTLVGRIAEAGSEARRAVVVSGYGTPQAKVESIQASGLEAGAETGLFAVACPTSGGCVAVGYAETAAGGEVPLIVTDSGAGWQARVAPLPGGATHGFLEGVSCGPGDRCVAVGGYYGSPEAEAGALAVSESASGQWTPVAVTPPAAGYTYLESVSCDVNGDCAAVGGHESKGSYTPEAASESGGGWSAERLAIPSGSSGYLHDVSCPPEGACAAVGEIESPAQKALLARQGASGWSLEAVVPPPNGQADALRSVSCAAAGSCTAVGWLGEGERWQAPMAISETAGVWEAAREVDVPPGPAGPTEARGALEAVACVAPARCTAVGYGTVSEARSSPIFANSLAGLEVSTEALPAARTGTPYSAQLAATGGAGSYTWSVASGSLPSGLSLDPTTGVISGTPTEVGSSSFAVESSESGPPAQSASSVELTIAVAGRAGASSTAAAAASSSGAPRSLIRPPGDHSRPPRRRAHVRIASKRLQIAHDRARLRLACSRTRCVGEVALVARLPVRLRAHGGRRVRFRPLLLAKGSFAVGAGRAARISLKLTARGRRALRLERSRLAQDRRALRVTATVTVTRGAAQTLGMRLR